MEPDEYSDLVSYATRQETIEYVSRLSRLETDDFNQFNDSFFRKLKKRQRKILSYNRYIFFKYANEQQRNEYNQAVKWYVDKKITCKEFRDYENNFFKDLRYRQKQDRRYENMYRNGNCNEVSMKMWAPTHDYTGFDDEISGKFGTGRHYARGEPDVTALR